MLYLHLTVLALFGSWFGRGDWQLSVVVRPRRRSLSKWLLPTATTWLVVRCSSEDAMKTMVQAFVISRLDCCNTLCYGITNELTRSLQSVQNAAARLVTETRRCDHISPVLHQLHWLPVRQRVVFKIATLVHLSLSGNAPGYLAKDCQLVGNAANVRQLHSVTTRTLVVSRTCSSFGGRTFAATVPQVWNSLPPGGIGPWRGWRSIVLQCCYTVGWVVWPVKPSPKWPKMCRLRR